MKNKIKFALTDKCLGKHALQIYDLFLTDDELWFFFRRVHAFYFS